MEVRNISVIKIVIFRFLPWGSACCQRSPFILRVVRSYNKEAISELLFLLAPIAMCAPRGGLSAGLSNKELRNVAFNWHSEYWAEITLRQHHVRVCTHQNKFLTGNELKQLHKKTLPERSRVGSLRPNALKKGWAITLPLSERSGQAPGNLPLQPASPKSHCRGRQKHCQCCRSWMDFVASDPL